MCALHALEGALGKGEVPRCAFATLFLSRERGIETRYAVVALSLGGFVVGGALLTVLAA